MVTLAEHLVATELANLTTLATTTATVASTNQWHHALTVLSDAAVDHPHLDSLITDLVTGGPGTAAAVAARVASQTERPTPLVAALTVIADQLGDEGIDLLAAIAVLTPGYAHAEVDFAIRLAQRLVALRRAQAETRPDAFEPDLADSLNSLAQRLGTWSRYEDALAASEEAATIYRGLAAARPDAFEPGLADSLRELAWPLSRLGRREEARVAIEEATAIYRRLAAARPDAFDPSWPGRCSFCR